MTERRYQRDEVREIFGLATSGRLGDSQAVPDAQGLTLAELQSIGQEVGLDAATVASAAAVLDARGATQRRTTWGSPVEVGRIVQLSRPLTDHEWERLVAELRATFRARGQVVSHGGSREWSNGNLHACVEPTAHGYRLRLGTIKGDARGINALGVTGIATGVIAAGSLALSGSLLEGIFLPIMLSGAGVGALLANMLRLPRWAQRREQQMDYIAARAKAMGESDPDSA
jgi:hypothetical protein